MIRKILPYLISGLFILLIVAGYLSIRQRAGNSASDPWDAVPANAALIVVVNNSLAIEESLGQDSLFAALVKQSLLMDLPLPWFSGTGGKPEVYDSLLSYPRLLSLHPSGSHSADVLLLASLREDASSSHMLKLLRNSLNARYEISERRVPGARIFDFTLPAGKTSFSLALYDRIFLCSKSAVLLEDAIQHLQEERGALDPLALTEVKRTSGRRGLNLFLNYRQLPGLLHGLFSESMNPLIQSLPDFASWTEADLFVRPGIFLMGGFSAPADSGSSYLEIFLHQQAQGFEILRSLPGNTAAFALTGIEEPSRFLQDYERLALSQQQRAARRRVLESLKAEYDTDFETLFASFCGNQLALCITSDTSLGKDGNIFQLLRVTDAGKAEESLARLGKAGRKEPVNNLFRTVRVEDGSIFRIYRMPVPYLNKILFGQLYGGSENRYFSLIGDVLVFGNSPEGIAGLASDYVMQRTLYYDIRYNELSENLDSSANFFCYYDPSKQTGFFRELLATNQGGPLQSLVNGSMRGLGLQLSRNNGLLFGNLLVQSEKTVLRHGVQPGWKVKLDTSLRRKPWLVKNASTGRQEIMVQDVDHKLYLVSNSGQILWTHSLPEQVMGEVFQVDAFRNGKLQYLFCTSRELYLLDRNGKQVENYPVKLPFRAVSPPTLADFEKKREYRIYVGGEDQKLWCLDLLGRPAKGWLNKKLKGTVNGPVQFFRIGKLDYLLFSAGGFLQVWNRKGEDRIRLQEPIEVSENPFFLSIQGRIQRFAGTNPRGELILLSPDGALDLIPLGIGTAPHHLFLPPASDRRNNELLIASGDSLLTMDLQGQRKQACYISGIGNSEAEIIDLPNGSRVILYIPAGESRLNAVYTGGSMLSGFPVEASSQGNAGLLKAGDGIFNLLAGGKSNFLYNFIVE